MWKRIVNLWRALVNALLDKVEDPNMLLDQAKRDGQELLDRNRQLAVNAITQKNNLEAQLKTAQTKSTQLQAQCELALKQGKQDVAGVLMRQKMSQDATVAALQDSYNHALETCDHVKQAIANQEQQFKKQVAEGLVLKAKYSSAQAEDAINKALGDMQFGTNDDGFNRAAEMVQNKMSQASARKEMNDTSIDSKIMEVANAAVDQEAQDELAKMAERLGLATPKTTVVTGDLSSDAVQQHLELTQRLGG